MLHLFATTDLERSYRVNLNIIGLNGRPQVKDLKVILKEWIQYRTETVRKRLQFRLDNVTSSIHILAGLMIAYLNIDKIIKIIRKEEKPKDTLMKNFKLSDTQADAILNLRLRRLAKLEELKIKTDLGNSIKGEGLLSILNKISKVIEIYEKIPERYNKKVLEQIAIAGCLDTNKFSESSAKTKEAIDYISKRVNISRPEYDRGWKGKYSKEQGFIFSRELRGLIDRIIIDNNLLESQLIQSLNSNYTDIFQMFEMPGELLIKEQKLRVYSPSQLIGIIQDLGKKGLSMQRYKGLGEMNPDQLWETTLDPKNRSLIQVKIDDEESTKGVFEDLMGENVLPRKEFIENRADKVVNLDI